MAITEVPNDQIMPDDGEPTFESLAAQMPETAQGFLDAAPIAESPKGVEDGGILSAPGLDDEAGTGAPPPRKRINMSRKMKKAMDKFRDKAANVPIMWFHQQAKGNPAWELDDDEKAMLTDSIATVFDLLDINLEIEPLSMTLTSIWWVISYPVLAFAFLFLTKKSMTMEHKENEETGDIG